MAQGAEEEAIETSEESETSSNENTKEMVTRSMAQGAEAIDKPKPSIADPKAERAKIVEETLALLDPLNKPIVYRKFPIEQLPPIKKVVFQAEKTYTGIAPEPIPPLETTLARMSNESIWHLPCLRFKQWTEDESGLEFTLGVTIPCMPPNFTFGPFNHEQERVEMVRCITADLLYDKYAEIGRAHV